jgi:hypothetical protein
MQTIQINNADIEHLINSEYGNDTKSLLNDFVVFIKEKHTINGIKKGLDEVKLYEQGKSNLQSADDLLQELKSEY